MKKNTIEEDEQYDDDDLEEPYDDNDELDEGQNKMPVKKIERQKEKQPVKKEVSSEGNELKADEILALIQYHSSKAYNLSLLLVR
jgi:hypothetical protein